MRIPILKLLYFAVLPNCVRSSNGAEFSGCEREILLDAFTDDELLELEKTLTIRNANQPINKIWESPSVIESLCYVLKEQVNISCKDNVLQTFRRSRSEANNVWVYRDSHEDLLHITDCSSDLHRCMNYVRTGFIDDFLLTSKGSHIFYICNKQLYASSVKSFAMHHETMALLNVSNGNSRLIYCNGKLSLLFQQCNNRIKRFMLYKLGWDKSACVLCEHEEIIHTIKKRADSSNTDNSMTHSEEALRQRRLNFILTLAFAVPLGILCIAAVIAITICCCFCRKSGSNGSLGETEDDVPQSLIENARKAEPHASQKDKYLPENFDVAQFNFKGPLVIEHKPVFTTFHELEGDPPREQAVTDHVEFDPTMNEAYEIGEGVERLGETSKMPPTLQQQQQQQAIENVRKLNKEAVKEATFVKEVRDALKHARDRQKKSGKEVTGRSATQVKRDKRKLQIHGGLLRNTFDKNVRRSKHTTVEETQATQRSEDSSGWQNKKKKMEPEKPHPVCQQKFVEAHTATAVFLSSAATQSSIWTEAIPVSGSSVETQKSQTTVTGKTQDTSLLQFVRSMPRGKKSSTGKNSTKKTTKNIMTSTRKTVIERSKERATSRATSTDKK